MRAFLIAAAAVYALASAAIASPPPPILYPVFAAPIDRALANVASWRSTEVGREQLLGRLNLLAYAQNDAEFYYQRQGDYLFEGDVRPCPADAEAMGLHFSPGPQPGDLCAAGWRGGGETPATPNTSPNAAALARLEQARVHYARAVELEHDNVHARLGYAYVLERQGKLTEARRELRTLINVGLRLLQPRYPDYSTYYALAEARERLAPLAVSRSDRRALARLAHVIDTKQPMPPPMSPIVVPLVDARFDSLVDLTSPVAWNFSGQHVAPPRGWLRDTAAWLVWDPNHRANITSGFDMIGERAWGVFWRDGFEALRALDDNRDGELTGAELGGLALWRDANGDGVSQADEVQPVAAYGVVSLATRARATRPGLLTAPSGVQFASGVTRPLYDWTPGAGPVS